MDAHHLIRERLRSELDRRGLTAVELARNAGVKTSFIYDILNGKSTNPSTVKLAQVAEALGLNLAYLAGSGDAKSPRSGTSSDVAAIPRITVTASAGGGSVVASEREGEHYYFRRSWIRDALGTSPEHLRILHISGDSMEPTIQDKDSILIDTSRKTPSPPGIFVVFDGFGLLAKRLEYVSGTQPPSVRILSDNPQYSPYVQSVSELNIIGRVVWFARKLVP